MNISKFSESDVVQNRKEAHAGMRVKNISRKHGLSSPTYTVEIKVWRHGGIRTKTVKEIEAENIKLKRMHADLALEIAAMNGLITKGCNASRQARRS